MLGKRQENLNFSTAATSKKSSENMGFGPSWWGGQWMWLPKCDHSDYRPGGKWQPTGSFWMLTLLAAPAQVLCRKWGKCTQSQEIIVNLAGGGGSPPTWRTLIQPLEMWGAVAAFYRLGPSTNHMKNYENNFVLYYFFLVVKHCVNVCYCHSLVRVKNDNRIL